MSQTRIIELRTQRGWTQQRLADASGVTVRTLQRLEAGNDVSLDTLSRLGQALGVPVRDLFVQDFIHAWATPTHSRGHRSGGGLERSRAAGSVPTRSNRTPMAYLREVRLRHTHDALLRAEPGAVTVADVASARGFTHMGRFSAEYLQRFGEYPKRTLRR